jgi:hypothetical protein
MFIVNMVKGTNINLLQIQAWIFLLDITSDSQCSISCQVKGKCLEETAYSPAKKKRRYSTDLELAAEVTPSSSESLNMTSDVHAQHIGGLLSYLDCSVMDEGLLGMVIQKTNVSRSSKMSGVCVLMTCWDSLAQNNISCHRVQIGPLSAICWLSWQDLFTAICFIYSCIRYEN